MRNSLIFSETLFFGIKKRSVNITMSVDTRCKPNQEAGDLPHMFSRGCWHIIGRGCQKSCIKMVFRPGSQIFALSKIHYCSRVNSYGPCFSAVVNRYCKDGLWIRHGLLQYTIFSPIYQTQRESPITLKVRVFIGLFKYSCSILNRIPERNASRSRLTQPPPIVPL